MFKKIERWRRRRVIARSPISIESWESTIETLPVLHRLTHSERNKLIELAILFLAEKEIVGAGGYVVDESTRIITALQACLPILNLDLKWYAGWKSIIVYPSSFTHERTHIDEAGLTHTNNSAFSGEAWLNGPVILSWESTSSAGELDGQNVVIHEFIHKLDMLNGRANGFPPMHSDMSQQAWSRSFQEAFEDFQVTHRSGLDRYGATNPAEFFAVLGEVFFERADVLYSAYPQIYMAMTHFFKQNPLGIAKYHTAH